VTRSPTGGQIGVRGGSGIGSRARPQSGRRTIGQQAPQIQPGEKFDDHMTGEVKRALEDCLEVEQVAEWCADRCMDEGAQMSDCARLCKETADLADVTAKFVSRNAFTAPYVADAFTKIGEETLQELDQHPVPHTQETKAVLERALDSTYQALDVIGQQKMQQPIQGRY